MVRLAQCVQRPGPGESGSRRGRRRRRENSDALQAGQRQISLGIYPQGNKRAGDPQGKIGGCDRQESKGGQPKEDIIGYMRTSYSAKSRVGQAHLGEALHEKGT